jgi:hypothetical protein
MVRLDAETKQITHAIRMAACNAETILARALDGHYARASDEAYALNPRGPGHLRRHPPRPRPAAHPARPAHRPATHPDAGRLCEQQLNHAGYTYPRTDLTLHYEVKPHPGPA